MAKGKRKVGDVRPADIFYNVPVERDPQLHDDVERKAQALLSQRREAMAQEGDALPAMVDFQAEIWDFRPLYPGRPGKNLKVSFANLPTPRIRRFVKFFLRYAYSHYGTKATSLFDYEAILGIVTRRIVKAASGVHDELDLMITEDIIDACVREGVKDATQGNYLRACYLFWRYCIEVCDMDFPVSLKTLKTMSDEYTRLAKLSEDRTPDIPEEYYHAILSKSVEVMRAEEGKVRYNEVLAACVLVIFTQTGMRVGDLLSLRVDDLREAEVESTGEKTAVLEFGSSKPTKGHGDALRFTIYASPLCEEAFKRLLKLRKKSPMAGTPILVVPVVADKGRMEPYSSSAMRGLFDSFFVRHLPTLCRRPWPGIRSRKRENCAPEEKEDLWIPSTHQYRVHLCSYLYRKGVSIIIIEKHLAHLSESMYGYYIRMADDRDKLAGFAEKFIADYVRNDYRVSEPYGQKVQEAVLRFLGEKKVSVKASTEEILQALKGQVTVRQKGVGYCVKASFTPCSDEPNGNRLLCTFGMCPNYVTLFHAADATLAVFRGHVAASDLNLASGHYNAAAKELAEAREVAERHLSPQLRELERTFNAIGWDKMLERYPHLEDVVYNLSEIKLEVAEVMKRTIVKPVK